VLELMERNGLHPGQPDGWSFRWTKGEQEAGHCSYSKRELAFGAPLFARWNRTDCRETAVHEIAHALVPDNFQHSDAWRRMYVSLGGDGRWTTWGHHGEPIVRQRRTRKRNWEADCSQQHGPWTRVKDPDPSKRYFCRTDGETLIWHRI
jgi:predicted SprT family Zn-dependent metalloprotease